jgi:release factor glutamine methyltransferase
VESIHDLVAHARQRLAVAGIAQAEANLDARILAEHALGWDAARFFTDGTEPAGAEFEGRYRHLVERRAAREPMAYIIGRQEFWGLSFDVSPATLIPRPETELIVDAALERFGDRFTALTVLDVGTGTGCLAVSIAVERPSALVVASDISADALGVAARNADQHGVSDRIEFIRSDLFERISGRFDLIVSNPPYVAGRDRDSLPPEVRDHEPAEALFGGADGLDVIRRLLTDAPRFLNDGGSLVFEFGFGQAEALEQLIAASPGLTMVAVKGDLQGIPRIAIVTRSADLPGLPSQQA